MERQRRLATLAAICGNGIFGFSFMFSRIALNVTTPFVMLMYRFDIAFVILNLIALWSLLRRPEQRHPRDGEIHWLRFRLNWKRVLPLLAMGVFQPVAYFLCESYGISLTNSTVSGVIIALVPIVALVTGIFTLRETPRASQVIFAAVSILGVILMTIQQRAGGDIRPIGICLLFGAVVASVAFNTISRKVSGEFSALERTYVMFLIAAVVFTALALGQAHGDWQRLTAPLQSGMFLLAMVYLAIFSSILAFLMLNYANTFLPVAKSTAFCNLTTVISLFAGVVFLHEPFSVLSLAASVLIILGIWGVQRAK